MKAYYLKGLSTNSADLSFICAKFLDEHIDLYPLVENYSVYYNKSIDEIVEDLKSKLPSDGGINLVCHSMGCNIGVLLGNRLDNVKNIFFISPEFENVSKAERKAVSVSSNESFYVSDGISLIDKLKGFHLFSKSSKWIKNDEEISKLFDRDINISFFYSKGDPFVSRYAIYVLADKYNSKVTEIDSNSHNPILENTPCVSIISEDLTARENILKPY